MLKLIIILSILISGSVFAKLDIFTKDFNHPDNRMKFLSHTTYDVANEKLSALRPAHVEYLQKLSMEGKVLLSGPAELGGITLYDVQSKEELEELLANDPFTKGGLVKSREITKWDVKMINHKILGLSED